MYESRGVFKISPFFHIVSPFTLIADVSDYAGRW